MKIKVTDIDSPAAITKTDDTNVTLTLGGTPTTAVLRATSFTLGWTGTLSVARGGTGAATLTGYLKGNGTSAFTASATIPNTDISGLGTMATQNANAVNITGGSTTGQTLVSAISFSAQDSGAGGVKLETVAGGANTGYISFYNSAGVRRGYIGYMPTSVGAQDINYGNDTGGGHFFANNLAITGSVLGIRSSSLIAQHDGTNTYFRSTTAGGDMYLGVNNQNLYLINTTALTAVDDNARTCGWSAWRWSVVYAATGSINTSDARQKKWRGAPTAAELKAAKEIVAELGFYQWLDAIEKKGEAEARYHYGPRAQKVWAIMASNGLIDPVAANGKPSGKCKYAFLCYDEWEDTPVADTVRAAGNSYGIRPDQLILFLITAQEARIAALEALLK